MEWIIKIEGKKDRRILITFDPMSEKIFFAAQFKPLAKDLVNHDIKGGFIWVTVAEDMYSMKIDLTTIQQYIGKVNTLMEERLAVHEDLAKVFTVFKSVEIKEEEN
jgi:hypothetical protein